MDLHLTLLGHHSATSVFSSLQFLSPIILNTVPATSNSLQVGIGQGLVWLLLSIAVILSFFNTCLILFKRKRSSSAKQATPVNTKPSQDFKQLEVKLQAIIDMIERQGNRINSLSNKIDNITKKMLSSSHSFSAAIRPASGLELYSREIQSQVSLNDPAREIPFDLAKSDTFQDVSNLNDQPSPTDRFSMQQIEDSGLTAKPKVSKLTSLARAIEANDTALIRELAESELNITRESDDALARRVVGHKTQLEDVSGGGSYYRLTDGNETRLFPTSQSLKLFAKTQRSLGTFNYQPEPNAQAEIKHPALIAQAPSGRWEVLEMGVIVVPE